MSQYDVYRPKGSDVPVVDCQSDVLAHLPTRFVIAMLPIDKAPVPAERFNPVLSFAGADYQLSPQYVASLSMTELGEPVGSLAGDHHAIVTAIDFLIGGY
ncbi:CcdB family protein [Sphingomonas sp. RB1R13]|uniref:CcdB family protein n=1 Tax=Sphingomonas sp. RB1R13 TaxID=3096159 RepID=UPI002FC5B7B5